MKETTLVIDTPSGIEAYKLIGTLHGLRMEINMQEKFRFPPTACPTRGMALAQAKRIQQQYSVPGRPWRTRKQALAGMQTLCEQLGLTQPTR